MILLFVPPPQSSIPPSHLFSAVFLFLQAQSAVVPRESRQAGIFEVSKRTLIPLAQDRRLSELMETRVRISSSTTASPPANGGSDSGRCIRRKFHRPPASCMAPRRPRTPMIAPTPTSSSSNNNSPPRPSPTNYASSDCYPSLLPQIGCLGRNCSSPPSLDNSRSLTRFRFDRQEVAQQEPVQSSSSNSERY